MAKYHINSKGEAGACRAAAGNCPFGGEHQHYDSAEKARQAYELAMGPGTAAPATKKAYPEKGDDVLINANASLMDASLGQYVDARGEVVDFNGTSYFVAFPDGETKQFHWQSVRLAPEVPANSYERVRDEVVHEIQGLRQLALGSRHNRALEALEDAQFGKPSKGYNGGRYELQPVDQIEALTKARSLIGKAGNAHAYDKINELIGKLEATDEVQKDGYYQADKALRTVRLPAGAKRTFDKEWRKRGIDLGNGRFVEGTANHNERGKTTFTLRERTGGRTSRAVGRSGDLTALLKGDYERI